MILYRSELGTVGMKGWQQHIDFNLFKWDCLIFLQPNPKNHQDYLKDNILPSFLHRDSKHLQHNQELEKMTITVALCRVTRITYIAILAYPSSYIMLPFICGGLKEHSHWVLQEMWLFPWLSAVFPWRDPDPTLPSAGSIQVNKNSYRQMTQSTLCSRYEEKMADILIPQQLCSFF